MRITSYEVRSTARALRRHPGFAVAAVVSLAAALAINTTMYSTLDALFNPRISVPRMDELHHVRFIGDTRRRLDQRAKNQMLEGADGIASLTRYTYRYSGALLESATSYRSGLVVAVAPNYFSVLGVRAAVGRLLSDIDVGASTPSVVISERAVRDLFPKRANPIGERIQIEGEAHMVIGVLDRASAMASSRVHAWTLPEAGVDPATLQVNLVRLREGMTAADGERALRVIADRIATHVGESARDTRVALMPLKHDVAFRLSGFQRALVGAVVAVLLVACANIANLQLARGIARSGELATRTALGASRRDLIAHMMLESGMLAAAGLVLGLLLTFWGMHLVRASIPDTIGDYIVEPQTSWRLFAFAFGATALSTILIGLVPAIRVSRVDVNELMKRGAGTGSTRSARRQYGYLIAAEIGFALVVLCAAALLVRAAYRYEERLKATQQPMLAGASARVALHAGERRALAAVGAELVARIRSLPDVADGAIFRGAQVPDNEITATDPGGKLHVVPAPMWGYQVVSPSFFRTFGYEIAHGRDFLEGEIGPVALVDPLTARRLWPGTSAIGQMIKFGSPGTPGRWYTVVGVRKPVGLESTELATTTRELGAVFVLPTKDDQLVGAADSARNPSVGVVVRAQRNAHRLPVILRRALANDPRFSLGRGDVFGESAGTVMQRANQRFVGMLFSVFAILAVGLAAFGVYAIVAHSVAERRREIGVRLALGSSARNILYVVLREGNVFALAGIAIGLWLIRKGAPLLSSFLAFPEIDVHSVELYAPAAVFFFAVAATAAFVPAWRATRIDPVEAIRCE